MRTAVKLRRIPFQRIPIRSVSLLLCVLRLARNDESGLNPLQPGCQVLYPARGQKLSTYQNLIRWIRIIFNKGDGNEMKIMLPAKNRKRRCL